MFKVLVCGGREFKDIQLLAKTLHSLDAEKQIDFIIHGGAKGADILSGAWAQANGAQEIVFPANWNGYGKAAGPIRNKKMLVEGKPDLVIAFPGGRGTANMVKQAREAGVEVREIKYDV